MSRPFLVLLLGAYGAAAARAGTEGFRGSVGRWSESEGGRQRCGLGKFRLPSSDACSQPQVRVPLPRAPRLRRCARRGGARPTLYLRRPKPWLAGALPGALALPAAAVSPAPLRPPPKDVPVLPTRAPAPPLTPPWAPQPAAGRARRPHRRPQRQGLRRARRHRARPRAAPLNAHPPAALAAVPSAPPAAPPGASLQAHPPAALVRARRADAGDDRHRGEDAAADGIACSLRGMTASCSSTGADAADRLRALPVRVPLPHRRAAATSARPLTPRAETRPRPVGCLAAAHPTSMTVARDELYVYLGVAGVSQLPTLDAPIPDAE